MLQFPPTSLHEGKYGCADQSREHSYTAQHQYRVHFSIPGDPLHLSQNCYTRMCTYHSFFTALSDLQDLMAHANHICKLHILL